MLGKDIYNAAPMMVLCVLAMVIVVVQPVVMLRMAWKHGKEMGIQTQEGFPSAPSSPIPSPASSVCWPWCPSSAAVRCTLPTSPAM